ncbi:MAG: NADH-quinone oxidoreductase subunit C [Chloroflexi bacterium]|nr:NADH-quinone oxidoreductase subunit C [Chloroflexota bacterium]
MASIHSGIRETCRAPNAVTELPRRAPNETHFVFENGEDLVRLCQWAKQESYHLCTLVVTDERQLEDNAFKVWYVLHSAQQELVILEYALQDSRQPFSFPSIQATFPCVELLEREVFDLFGVSPLDRMMTGGAVLHAPYPDELHPLWANKSQAALKARINSQAARQPDAPGREHLPAGMFYLPVGPIHAGVIEAGHFRFHVAGEVIEDLDLVLGYKHKGIEKLFETRYTLDTGWELAERVSGDSSFAHSMAYCQAVESLASIELPETVHLWRALFLELERIYNHITDVSALAQDMAFDLAASDIAVLRERIVRLNADLTGHRLLRKVNFPGGVVLNSVPNLDAIKSTVTEVTRTFLGLGKMVMDLAACRNRMITTGKLTKCEAEKFGATGLVARASGLCDHDLRLKLPFGAYASMEELRRLVSATVAIPEALQKPWANRGMPVFDGDLIGDVLARFVIRVAEVETSANIIRLLLDRMRSSPSFYAEVSPQRRPAYERRMVESLRHVQNYEFGLGYVEGWRGDIFYWVMKGPGDTIFRCKVRDPSVFNWPAMRLAIVRKRNEGDAYDPSGPPCWENILADFPLINKSFNLSYAGNDG